MKLIVNTRDGSITALDECYIVDIDENSTDGMTMEKARTEGKSLVDILKGCGYGDLRYGNAMAFSPVAIRDEIDCLVQSGGYDDDAEFLEGLNLLTDDDINAISNLVADDDHLWERLNGSVEEALTFVVRNAIRKTSWGERPKTSDEDSVMKKYGIGTGKYGMEVK
jgi:hypothetical protein